MSFHKIGFIGLGLIGGSIAKKIHTLHPDVEIIATAGHMETIQEAHRFGIISNQTLCTPDDFYDCDYIFLCNTYSPAFLPKFSTIKKDRQKEKTLYKSYRMR